MNAERGCALRRWAGLWAASFFLFGCSLGPKYIAKDFAAPARVAVLPFSNQTNDVDGPALVRHQLIRLLPARGYSVMPPEEVDRVLVRKFGVTEGGQLGSVPLSEIGKALGADGLLLGELITFVDLPLGFTRKRTVRADLKLYRAATGELLWEDERGWTTPELHLDPEAARKALSAQIAERQIQKIRGTFLQQEIVGALGLLLDNLPAAH